jgi:hypothetical protein
MTQSLVVEQVVNRWNVEHSKGVGKRFPSLDLVRLENGFSGQTWSAVEYGSI